MDRLYLEPGSVSGSIDIRIGLHQHHMKITLNVHPAEGVRPHEEAYRPMAEALGKDWEKEEFIDFDITDPDFLDAYFTYLHHPNEEGRRGFLVD